MAKKPPSGKKVLFDFVLGYLGGCTMLIPVGLSSIIYELTRHIIKPSWVFYPLSAALFYAIFSLYMNTPHSRGLILFWGVSTLYAFIDIVRNGVDRTGKHFGDGPDGSNYSDWGCS